MTFALPLHPHFAPGSLLSPASPFFFLFPYFARGGAHVSYRCPVTSSSSYTCRGAPMHSIPRALVRSSISEYPRVSLFPSPPLSLFLFPLLPPSLSGVFRFASSTRRKKQMSATENSILLQRVIRLLRNTNKLSIRVVFSEFLPNFFRTLCKRPMQTR